MARNGNRPGEGAAHSVGEFPKNATEYTTASSIATIASRTSSPPLKEGQIMSAIAEHPTPIRAELSGDRRCSAPGIVVNAYAPVLTLARQFIRAGFPPDRILEVYRGATLCFCLPLATAARLEVRDSNRGRPLFVPWRSRSMRTTPPVAPNDLARQQGRQQLRRALARPRRAAAEASEATHG
jgi:hypothetical protein